MCDHDILKHSDYALAEQGNVQQILQQPKKNNCDNNLLNAIMLTMAIIILFNTANIFYVFLSPPSLQ